MNPRLAKRFAMGIGLGALIYLGFAIYADWGELKAVLGRFRWLWFLPVLALSLGNYFIRFLRWQAYLKTSSVSLETGVSMRIFFTGLVMSVTPGKLGELLKAYMIKMHNGTPISRTGPIVVAERVTDLVALFVLLFAGSLIYRTQLLAVLVSGLITTTLVVGLVSPRVTTWVLHLVERIPGLRQYGERFERAYVSMHLLLRARLFVHASALGVLAWFAECCGFTIVLRGFGIELSVAFATFIYSFATLVGALLLVPGGLGGTEATMLAMLMASGVEKEIAIASTFLTRIATLWFAVLIGALVLLANRQLAVEGEDLG